MIRQHHQPDNPQDIVRVLAPLSESVLQHVIEEKSKAMDLAWLNVMLDQDLLDMEDITVWSKLPVGSIEDVMLAWSKRIEAFLGFVSNGKLVEQRQAFAGRPDSVHKLAVLNVSETFKTWFDRAAAVVVGEHNDSIGRMTGPLGTDAQERMTLTLAKWTAAACLLDRPRVVEKMLALDGRVAETLLPLGFLGPQMAPMGLPMRTMNITPAFVALQFSRLECMDALLPRCRVPVKPLLGTSMIQNRTNAQEAMGTHPSMRSIDWAGHLEKVAFVPLCDAAMFTKMTVMTMANQDDAPSVQMGVARAMRTGEFDKIEHYLPAFSNAGVFDQNPLHYAQAACIAGFPGVIEGLKRIDWNNLSDVTVLNAARAHEPGKPDGRCEAICALIDAAVADDRNEKVMAMTIGYSPNGLDPVKEILSKGMESVLVKFLDSGISSSQPLLKDGPTIADLAQQANPEMANVVRSYDARRVAHHLIEEIMQASKNESAGPRH